MKTYLLTWNPKHKDADGIEWISSVVKTLKRGARADDRWSTGVSRRLTPNDRVFLLRQERDHPGIVGAGYVTEGPRRLAHWDDEKRKARKKANYVMVEWESVVLVLVSRWREMPGREVPISSVSFMRPCYRRNTHNTPSARLTNLNPGISQHS